MLRGWRERRLESDRFVAEGAGSKSAHGVSKDSPSVLCLYLTDCGGRKNSRGGNPGGGAAPSLPAFRLRMKWTQMASTIFASGFFFAPCTSTTASRRFKRFAVGPVRRCSSVMKAKHIFESARVGVEFLYGRGGLLQEFGVVVPFLPISVDLGAAGKGFRGRRLLREFRTRRFVRAIVIEITPSFTLANLPQILSEKHSAEHTGPPSLPPR